MTESKQAGGTYPPDWRVRVVVVTSVKARPSSSSSQSRSGCPCIYLYLHWPLPSAPGPDPCALGRETVAPPVQDEPCTGGDGCCAHSALCSRRTRNPSFQGPICPGPHVPQSALLFPSTVCVAMCMCVCGVVAVTWPLGASRIDHTRSFYLARYSRTPLSSKYPGAAHTLLYGTVG